MTDHAEYERLFVDWPELSLNSEFTDDPIPLAICRDHIREVLHGMGYAVQSMPWAAGDAKVYSAAAWPFIGTAIARTGPTFDAALIALARAVMEREHPEQAERVRAIVEGKE